MAPAASPSEAESAIAALVISIAPVVPGFGHALMTPGGVVANPDLFDHLYSYAWFVTFALSFAVYLLLMMGHKDNHAVSS